MTSSDERREVAATLREALGGHVAVECSKVAHALGLEYETHGMMYCFGSEEVRHLADLIDPTCHMSVEEVAHRPTLNAMAVCVYECDRCHAVSYIGDVCCYPEPRYCPYCGARCVDNGGTNARAD